MTNFNSFVLNISTAYTPDVIREDCYAIFKFSPEYKEDRAHFGFDWIRTGDALDYVAHDITYEGNVGRNFKGITRFPENSDDIDINFREDTQMYEPLCRSYLPGNISIFPSTTSRKENYHTPILVIYPKEKVAEPIKLVLELNILKKPKHIHLSYVKSLFEIQSAESLPCEPGKYKYDIEIPCKREIYREVYIYVDHDSDSKDKKLAGIMSVWRNGKPFRRSIKVLVLNVKFFESDDVDTSVITENLVIIKESLNQFLPHVLITPVINEIECDIGFNLEFRKRLIRNDGQLSIITYEESDALDSIDINESCIKPLDSFSDDYLTNLNTPDYHVIIISLGLKLCMLSGDRGIIQQGGYSYRKYVFLEHGTRKNVPVYECLHVLDLNHTFNNIYNNVKITDYTHKVSITVNMMDYAHVFGVKMLNWWEW